jgi:hypothetical protein
MSILGFRSQTRRLLKANGNRFDGDIGAPSCCCLSVDPYVFDAGFPAAERFAGGGAFHVLESVSLIGTRISLGAALVAAASMPMLSEVGAGAAWRVPCAVSLPLSMHRPQHKCLTWLVSAPDRGQRPWRYGAGAVVGHRAGGACHHSRQGGPPRGRARAERNLLVGCSAQAVRRSAMVCSSCLPSPFFSLASRVPMSYRPGPQREARSACWQPTRHRVPTDSRGTHISFFVVGQFPLVFSCLPLSVPLPAFVCWPALAALFPPHLTRPSLQIRLESVALSRTGVHTWSTLEALCAAAPGLQDVRLGT